LLQGFIEGGGIERVVDRSLALLERSGLSLRQGEQNITDPAAKQAYLTQLAQGFLDQELPLLIAGGVVEAA
jgi:hypothetical protein